MSIVGDINVGIIIICTRWVADSEAHNSQEAEGSVLHDLGIACCVLQCKDSKKFEA